MAAANFSNIRAVKNLASQLRFDRCGHVPGTNKLDFPDIPGYKTPLGMYPGTQTLLDEVLFSDSEDEVVGMEYR